VEPPRQNINVFRVSADFLTTGSKEMQISEIEREEMCIEALPQMLVEGFLTIHRLAEWAPH